jgi:SAM-dependent methyltransferase
VVSDRLQWEKGKEEAGLSRRSRLAARTFTPAFFSRTSGLTWWSSIVAAVRGPSPLVWLRRYRPVESSVEKGSLAAARRNATSIARENLACAVADGRQLPFHDAAFDAVLCHSMLETLGDPASAVAELRRVTKRGGVVGAASVEYSGLILAGEQTAGPRRFYDIRQQLWRAAGIAEPNTGRGLRGLFQGAGFGRVEAFADYVSYGTPDRVMAFARDRATECRDQNLRALIIRHEIASAEELTHLAAQWEKWGEDPGAFFAFAWCRVLAWP